MEINSNKVKHGLWDINISLVRDITSVEKIICAKLFTNPSIRISYMT